MSVPGYITHPLFGRHPGIDRRREVAQNQQGPFFFGNPDQLLWESLALLDGSERDSLEDWKEILKPLTARGVRYPRLEELVAACLQRILEREHVWQKISPMTRPQSHMSAAL